MVRGGEGRGRVWKMLRSGGGRGGVEDGLGRGVEELWWRRREEGEFVGGGSRGDCG